MNAESRADESSIDRVDARRSLEAKNNMGAGRLPATRCAYSFEPDAAWLRRFAALGYYKCLFAA